MMLLTTPKISLVFDVLASKYYSTQKNLVADTKRIIIKFICSKKAQTLSSLFYNTKGTDNSSIPFALHSKLE